MNAKDQELLNQQALDDPRPGDYWHETFCPYFLVVDRRGDLITVLSCLGGPKSYNRKDEPNARIDNDDDGTWSFDYSKSMVVDRAWMARTVAYGSIIGFVADVVRDSEKTRATVDEWRHAHQAAIKDKIRRLEQEWSEFTGWHYLKQPDTQEYTT
jgi:hypothetical protein